MGKLKLKTSRKYLVFFITLCIAIILFFPVSTVLALNKSINKDFDINMENEVRTGRIEVQIRSKGNLTIGQIIRQNQRYQKAICASCLATKEKGFPELTYFKLSFQLRRNLNYKLVVQKKVYEEHPYQGKWLPSRGHILRSQNPKKIPYQMKDEAIVDAYYPQGQFVSLSKPYLIRDVRGIDCGIYPFLVNTLKKKVKILKEIQFELVPQNKGVVINSQSQRKLQIFSHNKHIYETIFENFRWDHELVDGPGHMLVIYTSRDKDAIQPFIDHKKSLGFTVFEQEVKSKTNVKGIIKKAYDQDPNLLYVQLVGDWADIRCDTYSGELAPEEPPKDSALGLVAGSDCYYDLIISRFSANSANQVSTQINKIIDYETNPNQLWWKRGLGIASKEGAGDDKEYDYEHLEIIKEHKLIPYGYSRVYNEYGDNASVSGISKNVNQGIHLINYTGHGNKNGWATGDFNKDDVDVLKNGNKLPFIFSVACRVGKYSEYTCFAETWLRKNDGGAISALMSTIYQPWEPPMRGQDYMNDLLTGGYNYQTEPGKGISTDHGKTTLGSIVFNAFNLQIAEATLMDYNQGDIPTTQTWILFGDGSLRVSTGENMPIANIKANGSEGPITVSSDSPVSLTTGITAREKLGQNADWWIGVHTTSPFFSNNWYSYIYPSDWLPGIIPSIQTKIFDISKFEVLNRSLPNGKYTFYFAVDAPDGEYEGPWWGFDTVEVTVK